MDAGKKDSEAAVTIDELRDWAAMQPDAAWTDDDVIAAWQWLMRHGPASSWTNPALLLVRRALLEVIRDRKGKENVEQVRRIYCE
jgi:hypothetical protein